MTEPSRELTDALQATGVAWDAARTERTLAGARQKRVYRRRSGQLGAALSVLLALGAGLFALRTSDGGLSLGALLGEDVRTLQFEDGSHARLLDSHARVVVSEVSRSAIEVSLTAGRARFEVEPRAERRFRVVCGQVVVQVIGTAFDLTRDGERTRVEVSRGRVQVRWPGGVTELSAGESGWFGGRPEPASARRARTEDDALDTAELDATVSRTASPSERETERRASSGRSWKQHAEQGDFGRAYALLEKERVQVADDVEELLLASDAARLSGHAAQALPFLHKVIERHARDPRAPLAAFTLGGVLMNQLGRPREAESAYARARALAPESSLAQDALARQVEAAHRAGDAQHAQALALDYLERYPDGRRVQAVRRFGGLP
jgi:transmembrane sensor